MDIASLKHLEAFANATQAEVDWLFANGSVVELVVGEVFFKQGKIPDVFYITLEGELQVTLTTGNKTVVLGTTPAGVIGGELALMMQVESWIDATAIVPSRLLTLTPDKFREMFGACPNVAAYVLLQAGQRTQSLAKNSQQQEKMAALGKLSAGLAHELNNPAAASRRAASSLRDALPKLLKSMVNLNGVGLSDDELERFVTCQKEVLRSAGEKPVLSPLERSDREDEIGDWLDEHAVEDAWDLAPTFVTMGITVNDLITLTDSMTDPQIDPAMRWFNESLHAVELLDEIEQSNVRISELVKAVKSYTYMDKAPVQDVDIHQGLENTLKVLTYKLRSMTVNREYDPDLPQIVARGGELNQVWTNLIDNAIDAVHGEGILWVITRCENNFVMVEIADNGPGIPPEVQSRLFEPFFTTKEVGKGTGLGLDIVYRIIKQHSGTIETRRENNRTRFIVRLPVESPLINKE